MPSEFLDAYSDDQIYLEGLETLVNEHPVEAATPEHIKYSSFSRLWAVMMVGSVECMIKEWGVKPGLMDIYSYFDDHQSNQGRVKALVTAFQIRGIAADPEAFEDFLAVKYIRNAYVHGEWNEAHRAFAERKGFPGSLMGFEKAHFLRMKKCYYAVMQCIGTANMLDVVIETNARRAMQEADERKPDET
jgi:hypothetical protein